MNPFHYCQKKLLMKNHAPKTGPNKSAYFTSPNSLLLLVFLHTSLAFQGLSYTGLANSSNLGIEFAQIWRIGQACVAWSSLDEKTLNVKCAEDKRN